MTTMTIRTSTSAYSTRLLPASFDRCCMSTCLPPVGLANLPPACMIPESEVSRNRRLSVTDAAHVGSLGQSGRASSWRALRISVMEDLSSRFPETTGTPAVSRLRRPSARFRRRADGSILASFREQRKRNGSASGSRDERRVRADLAESVASGRIAAVATAAYWRDAVLCSQRQTVWSLGAAWRAETE
jgi:hypothetical protein